MSQTIDLLDPRSPTVEFTRTPIRVIKKIIDEENISTETRITVDSFISASPNGLMTSTPTIGHSNETDDSFHSAMGDNDIEPLIVNVESPEVKGNSKTLRRALGCINNHFAETPKTDMRRKLWRNMNDERVKKGVNMGVENTPPLPFKDMTASAPPKLYRYRKHT